MKGLLSVGILLLLCGCASNDHISLVAEQSQQALTRDGVPALLSSKRQVVLLRPASSLIQSAGRPAFIVAIYNPGKRPVELRASGITAQLNARSTCMSTVMRNLSPKCRGRRGGLNLG